jgi:hypothetical protein
MDDEPATLQNENTAVDEAAAMAEAVGDAQLQSSPASPASTEPELGANGALVQVQQQPPQQQQHATDVDLLMNLVK